MKYGERKRGRGTGKWWMRLVLEQWDGIWGSLFDLGRPSFLGVVSSENTKKVSETGIDNDKIVGFSRPMVCVETDRM